MHDALAGWGTDGLVLAALGCRVHMSERNPQVFAILDERLRGRVDRGDVRWMQEDARQRWCGDGEFDVVYLDPMFGVHPKTALPAKHMQVLAQLVGETREQEVVGMIEAARAVALSRVVVKRRLASAHLGEPHWRIRGRSVRFDVYLPG